MAATNREKKEMLLQLSLYLSVVIGIAHQLVIAMSAGIENYNSSGIWSNGANSSYSLAIHRQFIYVYIEKVHIYKKNENL